MAGTVTATQSGNTAGGMLLQVYVLVNAAGTIGPNTLSSVAAINGSITTTTTGSMVVGALCDGNSNATLTAESGCTLNQYKDTTNTNNYAAFFTTLTGTPGSTLVGTSTADGGNTTCIAAMEVLASGGTLAQSSSPALVGSGSATTLATASFTPPAGALLVAVVVTNGNATGAPAITMATTGTIPVLSWTAGPNATGASAGFHQDVGLWYAVIPTVATGIGGSTQQALPGPAWRERFRVSRRQHVPEITATPPVPVYPPQQYAQPGLAWKTRYRLPQRPKPTAPVNPPYIAGLGGSGYNSWFQDQYGQPRLMVSEQAWLLPSNAGRWNSGQWQADMDAYFAARAAQGYTAWYGIAWNNVHIDTTALSGGRTWDGIYPLNINGTPGAIATGSETVTLNNAFWQRIDYLFAAAFKKGISCFLNISQSYDISSAGSVWQHATNTQGTAFGAALVARYPQLSYPHVFWFFGDDDDGPNDSFYQAILTGMQGAGDTRPLVSCEAFTNCNCHIEFDDGTAFSGAFGKPNATYNWVYSYDAPYFGCEDSYNEGGTYTHIPAVYGDGVYYGDTGSGTTPDRAIRNFTWWALASGSRGFPSTSGPSLIGAGPTSLWQWANGSASWLTADPNGTWTTSGVGAVAAFFRELPDWHKLIPDTGNAFITAGRGTRGTCDAPGGVFNFRNSNAYVAGSITPAGTLAVIYCKAAMSITVDQTKMGAGYTATWVDPLSLATQSATPGTTYNSTPLGNNSAGDPDWVLVLQGPALGGPVNVTGTGAPVTAAGGAGALSAAANITGTGAAVTVASPAGTFAGAAATSGTGAPVTAASPGGVLSAAANITGTAAPVTAAGGTGAPSSAASITGTGALVTVAAPAGVAAGSSPNANVTGTGALVTVAGGTGTTAGGGNAPGAAASVTVAGGTGVLSSAGNVTGIGAPVTVAGPAGVPSAAANITGTGAPVTVAGGTGTAFGGTSGAANVTGTGASVTVASPAGAPHSSNAITGTGAPAAVAGGQGTASVPASVTGVAAHVTVAVTAGALAAAANAAGLAALIAVLGGQGIAAGGGNVIPATSAPAVTALDTSALSVTDPRDGAAAVTARATSGPSVS